MSTVSVILIYTVDCLYLAYI